MDVNVRNMHGSKHDNTLGLQPRWKFRIRSVGTVCLLLADPPASIKNTPHQAT